MERGQQEVEPLWVPEVRNVSAGSADAMRHATGYLRDARLQPAQIAVELAYLPADALRVLSSACPASVIVDALPVLERLRARKTETEVAKLRQASEMVVASMLAVIESHGPGATKRTMAEALRREQVSRGLEFDYCLITMGGSMNRAPSDQVWHPGDIVSLDSGGNFAGYIGDVCRMGVLGEPDAELDDLLAAVDTVQQAAAAAVRAGAPGGLVYEAAEMAMRRSPHRDAISFVAHGMGLVSHEVPHLTASGPVPYEADDRPGRTGSTPRLPRDRRSAGSACSGTPRPAGRRRSPVAGTFARTSSPDRPGFGRA